MSNGAPELKKEVVTTATRRSGAVLVVGGGIAGIQSSLDLADSGFKVYLVEDSPAIGGIMAQLDKTFPTNDCAMCVISPKLVECGRHLNIELLTDSNLVSLEGEPGNFTARVYKRPRFVDLDTCTGCGECAEVCPVSVLSVFDEDLVDRTAIYKPYAQASPNAFVIDKAETPPCQLACPSGIHVQGYIALVAEGKYGEAYDLIRKNNPFVSVCGRVCHHPCETECRRGEYDEPIDIRSIKRFIADYVHAHHNEFEKDTVETVPDKTEKVAVIGAGPAGLTCAFYLAREGYQVTIFEKDDKAGGMLRLGIPSYRLPEKELDWEIEQILREGIELRTNSPVGPEEFAGLREQYDALFVSVGFSYGRKLNIEGADNSGVQTGIEFLRNVNGNVEPELGRKMVVIGGGNVAIDVAKSAIRLGSEVELYCLESLREMPAHNWEITEAIEEGILINQSWGPLEIIGENGRVKGIRLQKCTSVFDSEGNFNPQFDEKDVIETDCEDVIIAIGQSSDISFLKGSDLDSKSTVPVDPLTFSTPLKGVFAAGDIIQGPASVVEAVGQAHEAAISIDRYLSGEDMSDGRGENDELPAREPETDVPLEHRVQMGFVPPAERVKDFCEVELGFSEEDAREEAGRCLECGLCSRCLQCEVVCEANAIDHAMTGEMVDIKVGAVILTSGAEAFDPSPLHEFGYGRYANVLTSIQFERILAASGPFEGHLQRPSDDKVPTRIAWLQCVGSRTEDTHMPYCSSVCCMYAIKEAIIAKEHVSSVEPTMFFMDMRAHGKDFDSYYERAVETGVRFIRSRVSKIREIADSKNLELRYVTEDGTVRFEEFDLVVLSVGLDHNRLNADISDNLGLRLNEYSFIDSSPHSPILTSRPGVFVSGPAGSPMDIPETVTQASGSVAGAAEILSDTRGTEITEKVYPEEIDVSGKRPRIGVFICRCGTNIASVVDVPSVVEFARTLPDVVYAGENLFTCSQDTQKKIKELIDEHRLNRIVVSSCSPSTHEPLFQETIREAGLNRYLFNMANIRNHCSWVHRNDPVLATEKAKILTRIAVGKSRLLNPLHTIVLDVVQKGLVVGGGLAGMTAALSVAEQGYDVALVERESVLGGNLLRLSKKPDGLDVLEYLDDLIRRLESHPRVHVYLNSTIDAVDGYIGNYLTSIRNTETGEIEDYEHGIIIITTGGVETSPDSYLYGDSEGTVLTQLELEKDLEHERDAYGKMKNVVMIQCVGSREEEHPYCSRVCCTQAVKNAIRLKVLNPDMNVYILYRDMRTYGFNERYYQRARALGVVFMRFDEDDKPRVEFDGTGDDRKIMVSVTDHVLGATIVIAPDRVILAPVIEPREDALRLSQMLKIPLNENRFFMEAHVKLRPVDFSAEGIYLAGLAHSPKGMDETISQAKAAAERACIIISSDEYLAVANIASVDQDVCAGCGICVSVCPYNAPGLVWQGGKNVCSVNTALCKGCGSCSSVCPSGAMEQLGYTEEQTLEMVELTQIIF